MSLHKRGKNMKILITNDDGINADGLVRLARVAKEFGEVYVVAPMHQQSANSHSLTLSRSFEATRIDFPVLDVKAYAVDGTPSDCVRIGVLNIVNKPDIVLSGINYGFNLASDIQYSATCGAAFEAVFQKVKAIAFSEAANNVHEVSDHYLKDILVYLIDKPFMPNKIYNVNFPECSLSECNGILYDRITSVAEFYEDSYLEERIDENRFLYTIKGNRNYKAEDGSDLKAIFDNYISVGIVSNIA